MGIAKKKSEQSTGAPKGMSDSLKKGPNHGKLLKKMERSKAHKSRLESEEEEFDSEDEKISDQPSELDNESDEDSSMVSGDSDEEDEVPAFYAISLLVLSWRSKLQEDSSEDEAEKARSFSVLLHNCVDDVIFGSRRELSDVPFEVLQVIYEQAVENSPWCCLQELQKDGKVNSKFNKDTSRKV